MREFACDDNLKFYRRRIRTVWTAGPIPAWPCVPSEVRRYSYHSATPHPLNAAGALDT